MSWAERGNMHLLGHIMRRLGQNPRAWGDSRQQADATRVLVAHKDAWVRDMVEGKGVDQESGEVLHYSIEEQRAAWIDCMQRAEAEIARISEQRAAA